MIEEKKKYFEEMMAALRAANINNWNDISCFLASIKDRMVLQKKSKEEFKNEVRKGIAFITYDYGIDGVSIEISKYASCFESILADEDGNIPELHFVGGDFYDKAEAVLKPYWNRFEIKGTNGWSKWYEGKWFSKLYYEDMPEGSVVSDEIAFEIWEQATTFAEKLGGYLSEKDISLIFPVNNFSNPGNFAVSLAVIMVSELMDIYVFNSNHDFFWEGGMPASERGNDPKGPRDHFFKNVDNKPFFSLFRSVYPWNGTRWAQVNINTQQSENLEAEFGIASDKLFELSTSISDEFFKKYTFDDVKKTRLTMAHILSDGKPEISPIPATEHLANLANWMSDQKPVVCAVRDGLTLDTTTDKTVYCLQPTRIVARKRIEKDLHLLAALMEHPKFRDEFAADTDYQIVLHITGPVPIEHQEDTETVLKAYIDLVDGLPEELANRIFIAFSVGTENHPSLESAGLKRLHIEDIYRLATVILFPSETEGRGLPIIEASASGIPILCSRYYPEDVFMEVVGEKLSPDKQIQYVLFPEGEFGEDLLNTATDLMLHPTANLERIAHNKNAVMQRYGTGVLVGTFNDVMELLRNA
jgi:glycosyltransferase involved in cell wall biosynthesis